MDSIAPRRGRSMADLQALSSKVFTPEEIGASIRAWKPRSTDVVIAPYGKCGTTWLQQIFHTLRTGGDMDFPDISAVVPWIETAACLGIDIDAEQRANPRGFKSHMGHDELPPGAKGLVSLRDPKDALVSFYHFMSGWFLEPGAVSLDAFAAAYLERTVLGSYWGHLLSWWKVRHDPNVLLLSYEHMLAEPEAAIRRVADFAGIPVTDELVALTLERSSIAYMLEYKDRFDDALMRQLSEARCNLPPGSESAKVRKGGAGGHVHELSAAVSEAMDARWRELVTPVTGHADYAALEADLRAGR